MADNICNQTVTDMLKIKYLTINASIINHVEETVVELQSYTSY